MTENKSKGRAGPMEYTLDAERGILLVSFDEGAVVDIEHGRAGLPVIKELSDGQPIPMLVDFAGLKSQSKECRHYFANDDEMTNALTAVAIVVGSALSKIIANFYMGINKPKVPTRLFNDRDEAIEWLERSKVSKTS